MAGFVAGEGYGSWSGWVVVSGRSWVSGVVCRGNVSWGAGRVDIQELWGVGGINDVEITFTLKCPSFFLLFCLPPRFERAAAPSSKGSVSLPVCVCGGGACVRACVCACVCVCRE